MTDPILRTVATHEAPALAELIAGFRDHLGESEPTDAQIARQVPIALADPAVEFVCAWEDGRALGYTQTRFLSSVWVPGIEAYLEDIYVRPEARRRSVGRALLRDSMVRAQARGARRYALTTNEGNVGAQALYRSEGIAPQSHARFTGGREVLWGVALPRP